MVFYFFRYKKTAVSGGLLLERYRLTKRYNYRKGVLFDAIPMFLCFFCELFRHGLRRAQTLLCKGFLPIRNNSAPVIRR